MTQPPSAFAHGYLQSLPPFSGMPVQRNPRSSAGPTASGLPLEPQITIPLLSEQEAQDPAVPANVPQPFVAETPKTQRAESALQATASSPQHCTGSTCRPGLHNAAASSRLFMPSTARATSAHDLAFCNTDKTTCGSSQGTMLLRHCRSRRLSNNMR